MAASELAFDELVIEEVRKYPVLYQTSRKTNVNKTMKDNAWRLIADSLKTNGMYLFYSLYTSWIH